jgi:hypothetical protein
VEEQVINNYEFGLDWLGVAPPLATVIGADADDRNVVPTWMKVVGALAAMTLVLAGIHYAVED